MNDKLRDNENGIAYGYRRSTNAGENVIGKK